MPVLVGIYDCAVSPIIIPESLYHWFPVVASDSNTFPLVVITGVGGIEFKETEIVTISLNVFPQESEAVKLYVVVVVGLTVIFWLCEMKVEPDFHVHK